MTQARWVQQQLCEEIEEQRADVPCKLKEVEVEVEEKRREAGRIAWPMEEGTNTTGKTAVVHKYGELRRRTHVDAERPIGDHHVEIAEKIARLEG